MNGPYLRPEPRPLDDPEDRRPPAVGIFWPLLAFLVAVILLDSDIPEVKLAALVALVPTALLAGWAIARAWER